MNIIEIKNLEKKHKDIDLYIDNFYLKKGENLAVLGDENSGKSVLFKILTNIYSYQKGSVKIFAEELSSNASDIKARLGAIPKSNWLVENKSARHFLKSTKSKYQRIEKSRINHLVNEFSIENNKNISNMSPLERRRLAIVNGLMLSSELLLIEEPMTISSELIRQKLYREISYMNNSTITFSQNLNDILSYCQRIYYMKDGKIIHEEIIGEDYTSDKVLTFRSANVGPSDFESINAICIDQNELTYKLYFDGHMPDLTRLIYQKGLVDYTIRDANLEEKLLYIEASRDVQ